MCVPAIQGVREEHQEEPQRHTQEVLRLKVQGGGDEEDEHRKGEDRPLPREQAAELLAPEVDNGDDLLEARDVQCEPLHGQGLLFALRSHHRAATMGEATKEQISVPFRESYAHVEVAVQYLWVAGVSQGQVA